MNKRARISDQKQEQYEKVGPSRTMREEVKEERSMGNDVEEYHSEGDEPDLQEFIRTQERKKTEK